MRNINFCYWTCEGLVGAGRWC